MELCDKDKDKDKGTVFVVVVDIVIEVLCKIIRKHIVWEWSN